MEGRLILLLLLSLFTASAKHHRHRAPIIELRGADQLVASIREDVRVLNTVPELAIVPETGAVCAYDVTQEDLSSNEAVPFSAEVIDQHTGAAVIRIKDGHVLDCKKPEYNLRVTARRCDDEATKSESVPLKVTVKDTNNHAPEFDQPWYTFTVDEGKIHPEIARLRATDQDCGHPYGQICKYEITNGLDNFPFAISPEGVLRNTQPLNASQSHSYILTVVAVDCAMRKSKSALVTVNVHQTCSSGWKNAGERVDYAPKSGQTPLLPVANFHICDEVKILLEWVYGLQDTEKCNVESVEAVVELHAAHVSDRCARENVFSNSTRDSCGINPNTVNLLPDNVDRDDSSSSSSEEEDNEVKSTVDQNMVQVEEKSEKFVFDGHSNSVIVPPTTLKSLIPDKFSLSFAMRHARGAKEEQSQKQHILCESDDSKMNRHHFSVYVRHCKLEVVLRREAGAAAEFRAAEWRWATPEVCDDDWHTYTLTFNGVDDVHLLIDGQKFHADERNPEILDDWPLHNTKQLKTRVVVGACWHGRSGVMAQFFKGHLASMFLLPGETEKDEAIACAHRCPEQLQFIGANVLKPGESAVTSTEQNKVTLRANSVDDISNMLHKVVYENRLDEPLPGHRQFHVSTRVNCKEGAKEVPSIKGYVFVQKAVDPILSISGSAVVTVDHHQVKVGAPMLPELAITVSQTGTNGAVSDVTALHSLDYCKVHLKPSRDMDLEYFSSPASLIASMKIDFEHDKQGILLRGEEKVKGYREVLSRIHYFNTRPEAYTKRIYSVQCSMLKGRVLSNEFIVTMSIESPRVELSVDASSSSSSPPVPPVVERHFEPSFDQIGSNRLQNILEMDLPRPKALLSHRGSYDIGQGAIAGGAVAVVVVVCVGLLLVLLVVGVLKMRDAPAPRRKRGGKKNSEGGMEWDDSGMNITVNPLDDVEKNGVSGAFSEDENENESDSDEESYRDEEELSEEDEEDEEVEQVLPHVQSQGRTPSGGLEWDDSTLTNVARSYRV